MAYARSTLIRHPVEGVCHLHSSVPVHRTLLSACSESTPWVVTKRLLEC